MAANQDKPSAVFAARPDWDTIEQLVVLDSLPIPRWLGYLGTLPPVNGTPDNGWIYDLLRNSPLVFATQGEAVFIHKRLYHQILPPQMRSAFGICSACSMLNDNNRSMFFRAVDAEVSILLAPTSKSTLLEDLARLQAAVLYQIMRIFYGNLEQRIKAERQEYLIRAFALMVLRRVDPQTEDTEMEWNKWILAESIRRTAVIAFKLYTMYSIFRHGVCREAVAIGMLPVSPNSGSWSSQSVYAQHSNRDLTLTHHDYARQLAETGRHDLEPFEKLLLVAAKDCPLTGISNG
jgi:hypothetical protein